MPAEEMSDEERARLLYNEGVFLYTRGNYGEAIEKWLKLRAGPAPSRWAAKAGEGIRRAKKILEMVHAEDARNEEALEMIEALSSGAPSGTDTSGPTPGWAGARDDTTTHLSKLPGYPNEKHVVGPNRCSCGMIHPNEHAKWALDCDEAPPCWCEDEKHCGAGVSR